MPLSDLNSTTVLKYDMEAWLPSHNSWVELTSASHCQDLQTKQFGTKFWAKNGSEELGSVFPYSVI